ncbi:MAG: hypothetical protein HC930_06280 [Hydrococcus sp. SU_1_0]|nr:hypothetical protein [Hydrococcus sp. SU_1_0]
MSKDKSKLSGDSDQDNLIQSSEGIVYGLAPIGGVVHHAALLGAIAVVKGKIISGLSSASGEHSEKEIQIIGVENSETENNSKYSAELDEIFTQLHEADYCIAETRQNTVRLGIETRSILDDLRKQLG